MQFISGFELNWFVQGLRTLMAWLCEIIYSLISYLYNLFINLTKINILSNDTIKPIYQRITLILTIVMIFYVTFQFVKYIVQPDMMTDKEKGAGNIVYKMIAVVLLIAFVPNIFTSAIKLQNAIIGKGVIGKVILGQNYKINDNFGGTFAYKMLEMFYSVPEEYANEKCEEIPCAALVGMNKKSLIENGTLPYLTTGINAGKNIEINSYGEKGKIKIAFINFDGLFAVLVGGFIVYMLVLYCIDIGVRWAQLIYLQVIAPIPIIGFLSPKKDGIFQKWCKQCLVTYLDIFIRMAIIYLILLLTSILLNADTGYIFENVQNESTTMKTFITIALIMGLLLFAHKAPKMLAELFPKSGTASGNFGLSAKDRGLNHATRVLGAATGAATGAAVGLATGIGQGARAWNRHGKGAPFKEKFKDALSAVGHAGLGAVGGAIGGAGRGLYNGSKKGNFLKNSIAGAKNQVKANRRFGNNTENEYGIFDQIGDATREAIGARSRTETREAKKERLKRDIDSIGHVKTANDDIRKRAEKKMQEGAGGKKPVTQAKVSKYRMAEQKLKDFMENPEERRRMMAAEGKSEEELRKKLGEELQKAKEEAINAYIDNEEDEVIKSARNNLATHLKHDLEQRDISENLREELLSLYKRIQEGTVTAEDLDNKIIKEKLSPIENKSENEQIELDREIEKIKRQQQGNAEGKK